MSGLEGKLILNRTDVSSQWYFLLVISDCLTQYHFKRLKNFLTHHMEFSFIIEMHKALKGYKEIPEEGFYIQFFSAGFLN